MNPINSFRLVIRSTDVATKAIKALNGEAASSPLVHDALASIAHALRVASSALVVHEDPVVEQPPSQLVPAAQQVIEENDYDSQPREPAIIEQEIRGCKTLLLEVVRRAAYDWVLYRTSTRILHKKLAEDAYTWLFEEAPGHPNWEERAAQGKTITSFTAICSELDIDAKTVREYVRKLTVKNVMSVGRPAEYRRRESSTIRNRHALTEGSDSLDDDF